MAVRYWRAHNVTLAAIPYDCGAPPLLGTEHEAMAWRALHWLAALEAQVDVAVFSDHRGLGAAAIAARRSGLALRSTATLVLAHAAAEGAAAAHSRQFADVTVYSSGAAAVAARGPAAVAVLPPPAHGALRAATERSDTGVGSPAGMALVAVPSAESLAQLRFFERVVGMVQGHALQVWLLLMGPAGGHNQTVRDAADRLVGRLRNRASVAGAESRIGMTPVAAIELLIQRRLVAVAPGVARGAARFPAMLHGCLAAAVPVVHTIPADGLGPGGLVALDGDATTVAAAVRQALALRHHNAATTEAARWRMAVADSWRALLQPLPGSIAVGRCSTVTIVVLLRRSGDGLGRALDALKAQTCSGFAVLVMATCGMACAEAARGRPGVSVLHAEGDDTMSTILLEAITTPLAVLLDGDLGALLPEAVQQLCTAAELSGAAVVVGQRAVLLPSASVPRPHSPLWRIVVAGIMPAVAPSTLAEAFDLDVSSGGGLAPLVRLQFIRDAAAALGAGVVFGTDRGILTSTVSAAHPLPHPPLMAARLQVMLGGIICPLPTPVVCGTSTKRGDEGEEGERVRLALAKGVHEQNIKNSPT